MPRHSAGTTNDIEEWAEATREARVVRAVVADQVRSLIVDSDVMGSPALTSRRVREVVFAERAADYMVLRGAVIQLSVSAAAWAAQIDLVTPASRRAA